MWFWDFSPASHAYKKPITKKQLRQLQENYAMADEVSKRARELEAEEQKKASAEMEDMLDDIL
ncbi:MAG: hypothetical protein ACD_3C00198G0012 [uncultured bacterium (gcode 4)]|uniref:Uncharacterized protein n=1 Tax=uncultured bacterium (gcode 4) TaxID=1234023 RepID=K2FX16_9BACT|nr:MAG: hypothetical protein ACD_3C00198G0012 [uncultured bacterium (gcode 4)]